MEVQSFVMNQKPVEVVQASGKDALWLVPKENVPGTSNWEKGPRLTKVQVERLYFCTGLTWECLGILLSELADVVREREAWGPLLPPRPDSR